jgi:methylenetetrahydrofolate--tRNA-(uracil-5-)-methyltransferase
MGSSQKILVVGAGLAGSDAAWFLAENGQEVVLVEGKSLRPTPAQKMKTAAELVCTNSLKSKDPNSAHGLLKYEMKAFNSLVLSSAEACEVPAGGALAVDRELFSELIHKRLNEHPKITLVEEVVEDPNETAKKYNCEQIIIATGPLTDKILEEWIQKNISHDDFYFYDAIAPVVDADSLNYEKLYFKDRHIDHSESADYLNVPLDEKQYYDLMEELRNSEKVPPQDFEELKYFESCLPIDTMAERGVDTPRFGPMKPIGLALPNGEFPYAVVQLRKENLLGSAYNLVGFQTRMKYGEQKRILRTLPGFEEAEFIHLGSVHRNSFLNAKKLLNQDLSSKTHPHIYFAGQMTGVEGYTESAACGLYVAFQLLRKLEKKEILQWPVETAIGALMNYILTADKPRPSNINFGLMPTIPLNKEQRKHKRRKSLKKQLASERAKEIFDGFWQAR